MARRIKDRRLLALLGRIADSGAGLYRVPGVPELLGLEPGFPPARCGLPLGNLTSQWWGGHYLSGLDHFVKRELRVPHYQRYLDDLTLAGDCRSQLVEARAAVAAWLQRERRLELKHPNAPVRPASRRFTYLGYVVSRAGAEATPRVLRRMRKRVAVLVRSASHETIERSMASWLGVVRFVDTGDRFVDCRQPMDQLCHLDISGSESEESPDGSMVFRQE